MLNKAGLGCSLQCTLQRYACFVKKLPQKLSHKPYLHEGNQYQREAFIEIPEGPVQVESARTATSKSTLRASLALTLMLQVRMALADGHIVHINMELAGSQSPNCHTKRSILN